MQLTSGHTALITGGASGIGLGIARVLFAAGLKIAVADIRDDHFAAARQFFLEDPARVLEVHLDVASRDGWTRAAEAITTRFGEVHVLCLNAGIGVLGPIVGATPDDWSWLMGVNLGGVVNGILEMLPRIRSHGQGGHIVATSSMGGLIVGPSGGIYSTAKFGVIALMECLRRDLAAEKIGVSVLCPAAVNTQIYDHGRMRPEHFGNTHYVLSEQEERKAVARAKSILAMGRSPLEVGRFVRSAIENNDAFVFTDSNVRSGVEARVRALLHFAAPSHGE